MTRDTHSLGGIFPSSLPIIGHRRPNTLSNIHLPSVRGPRLQPTAHLLAALGLHKPGRGSKVVFPVARQQCQNSLDIRPRLGQPFLQRRDALRVFQIEGRHLHVPRALARTTGEVVGVVFEIAALEGDEGDDGGGFARRGDAVGFEGGVDEGSGLGGGFAFVGEFGPGAGTGCGGHRDEGAGGAFEENELRWCGRG